MWTVQSKILVSTLIMKVYVEYIKQQTGYTMTASEDEEKMLKKDNFHWENHYVKCSTTRRNLENIRFFPRLFISSCIFNTSFSLYSTSPFTYDRYCR